MPKGIPPDKTKFKPGQSGNPKGRPRKIPGLDELLNDVLGEEKNGVTVAKMILLALAKKALHGDVRAAEAILDRMYGKAKQGLDISGMINMQGSGFDYTSLSDEHLAIITKIINQYEQLPD